MKRLRYLKKLLPETYVPMILVGSLGVFLVAGGLPSCRSEQPVASNTTYWLGHIRGHEDLLRWAIESANPLVAKSLKLKKDFYPEITYGERAHQSWHPMVRGNYATDMSLSNDRYSLNEYYGADKDLSMAFDSRYQAQHFMRNFNEDTDVVTSNRTTCLLGQRYIVRATKEALNLWESNRDKALFFVGHASHVLQDSFPEGHVVRSDNYKKILDICIYDELYKGICYHPKVDLRDNIWSSPICDGRDWDCLRTSAKHAVHATTGYLYQFAALTKKLEGGKIDEVVLKQDMQAYFTDETATPYGGGYLDCSNL